MNLYKNLIFGFLKTYIKVTALNNLTTRTMAEESGLIKPRDINISKLKYGEPKTLKSGGRVIYAKYNSQRLTVQLPWMSLPYGVNDESAFAQKDAKAAGKSDTEATSSGKYALNISFRGSDTNPKIAEALEKFKALEKKIIDDAFDNRLTWLKDDYDGMKPLVAKLFSPIIKYDKDKDTGKVVGKYPPTMKLKLPYDSKTETFKFDAQNKTGDTIDFKEVMLILKGGRVLPIVELSGIWVVGGKYGCTWTLASGRFEPPNNRKLKYLPESDDEDVKDDSEDDDEDVVDVAEAVSKIDIKKNDTVASESEEEGDSEVDDAAEESEEEPPPPPPPPAKKTTKSKK